LVKLSKVLYREQRNKMIESMSSDVHHAWQDEGRRFKSFQLRLMREKPREPRLVCLCFGVWGGGSFSGGEGIVEMERKGRVSMV
jgi:hypothetical protein